MDVGFEIIMVGLALAIVLATAGQGNPRPSYFVCVLAAFAAVYLTITGRAPADMILAWVLTAISGIGILIGRRVQRNNPAD